MTQDSEGGALPESTRTGTSPLISNSLLAVRDRTISLRDKLIEARTSELTNFRPFLEEQIKSLDDTLEMAKVPDFYRVAADGSPHIFDLISDGCAGL